MQKGITERSGLTIGLDLGDKQTVGCVVSGEGKVTETFQMATTRQAITRTM